MVINELDKDIVTENFDHGFTLKDSSVWFLSQSHTQTKVIIGILK